MNADLQKINTMLEKDLEKAKRKYDQLCEERKKNDENVEPDDDLIDIEVLATNKHSGFRRQPGERPQPAPARPAPARPTVGGTVHKCSGCDFITNRKEVLSCHITQVHKRCDLCPELLNNEVALRDHLRLIHKKYNGTLMNCRECNFSALSKQHLRKHMDRHHKVAQKINKTCRIWRDGICTFGLKCKFQHKAMWCKFGAQCRDVNNCRFEHKQRQTRTNVRNVGNTRPNNYTQNTRQNNNTQFRFNSEEFPFLGKHYQQHQPQQNQCHCQKVGPMRRPGI